MKITVIGCGNMGGALIAHLTKEHNVTICGKDRSKGEGVAAELGGRFEGDLSRAVQGADYVILAIKPKDIEAVAYEISPALTSKQHLISILVGTNLQFLEGLFPANPITRMMPNLAIKVQKGIIGLVGGGEEKKEGIEGLFSAIGRTFWLEEKQMEAFASFTASSPAFIMVLVEAMVDAGISLGFSKKEALSMSLQVLQGTSSLLEESTETPQALRWQVTSPGGTTIEGVKALEENGFRIAIWEALEASYLKGKKISLD